MKPTTYFNSSHSIPSEESDTGIRSAGVNFYSGCPGKDHTTISEATFDWEAVERATGQFTEDEANRINRNLNEGINHHDWGIKREVVDPSTGEVTHQVQWWCRTEILEEHWRQWKEWGEPRPRTYTRKMNLLHLEGLETHYFCGRTDGEFSFLGFDLDAHNGEKDIEDLLAFLQSRFPGLHPEPSTNGRGYHLIFKISRHPHILLRSRNLWIRSEVSPREFHDLCHRWHRRLHAAIQALGFQAKAEIKGIPSYRERGNWYRGSLMRRPRSLTSQQIKNIPIYPQKWFEKQIAALEALVSNTPSAPEKAKRSPSTASTSSGVSPIYRKAPKAIPVQERYLPSAEPDAYRRMIHVKCSFVQIHSRLPDTPEELCDWYEKMEFATGDRDTNRLRRAQDVLNGARKRWVNQSKGRIDTQEYLEIIRRRVLSQEFTSEELSSLLALVTTNSLQIHGRYTATCPTTAMLAFMNRLADEGVFPRRWDCKLNRKAIASLTQAKLLDGIHTPHRRGIARIYRLGSKHPRYQEYCHLLREQSLEKQKCKVPPRMDTDRRSIAFSLRVSTSFFLILPPMLWMRQGKTNGVWRYQIGSEARLSCPRDTS